MITVAFSLPDEEQSLRCLRYLTRSHPLLSIVIHRSTTITIPFYLASTSSRTRFIHFPSTARQRH